MDTRALWEIGLGLVGLLASGAFNFWVVGYKVGKIRGADIAKIRQLTESLVRMEREQDRAANRALRIFQAIEQLRRLHKTGNGVEWVDLIGG